MDLDRGRIKILASETKVNILKSLRQRRKMPTELAKELSMATPTITGHMKQLEKSGLVKRMRTGHKWVYYELTDDGCNIIKPTISVNIMLGLAIGFVSMAGGYFSYLTGSIPPVELREAAADFVSKSAISSAEKDATYLQLVQPEINWLALTLLLVGTVFIIYSVLKYTKTWDFLE